MVMTILWQFHKRSPSNLLSENHLAENLLPFFINLSYSYSTDTLLLDDILQKRMNFCESIQTSSRASKFVTILQALQVLL